MEIKLIIFGKISKMFDCYSFKSVINQLFDEKNTLQLYIVVEPTEPIENYAYMQSCIFHDAKYNHSRCIEMRWESGRKFKHYRHVVNDPEEMYRIFTDFYINKKIPDVSGWEDVSRKLSTIKIKWYNMNLWFCDNFRPGFPYFVKDKKYIWFTKAQTEYIKNNLFLDYQPDKKIYVPKKQQQVILEYCEKSQQILGDSQESEIEQWIIKDIKKGKKYNFSIENYLCPNCGNFSKDDTDENYGICSLCGWIDEKY